MTAAEHEDWITAPDDSVFDATVPKARDDVLIRDVEGSVVAWSPIASAPVHLSPLAVTVLELLDGEVSAGDLVADLADVLDIDARAARDVARRQLHVLDRAAMLTTSIATVDHDRERDVFPAPPNP